MIRTPLTTVESNDLITKERLDKTRSSVLPSFWDSLRKALETYDLRITQRGLQIPPTTFSAPTIRELINEDDDKCL